MFYFYYSLIFQTSQWKLLVYPISNVRIAKVVCKIHSHSCKNHCICAKIHCNRAKPCKEAVIVDIQERISRIERVRKAQGLSIQQLADMSQLSASTVYRAITGKTEPEAYTIQLMEASLGITDKPVIEPIFQSIEPAVERYINTLLIRIERLRAHYNMLIATKNRWLLLSFTLNIILIVFLFCWIVYDIRTPAIGWIHNGYQNICLIK